MAAEPFVFKGTVASKHATAPGGDARKGAVLCAIPGAGDVWVPQSAIHEDSEVYKAHQTGRLVVVRWWAEKRGLGSHEA